MGVTRGAHAGHSRLVIERGLFDARITHVRHVRVPYTLSHRLWYLHVPLDALPQLPWPWLAYERPAFARLRDRDYGRGTGPIRDWIDQTLRTAGLEPANWQIRLVTLPRIAGLSFNPVSFWLCHDRDDNLRAVLAEVNSTFGERHCYLCRKADGGSIGPQDQISARKLMYVSPFIAVEGTYVFRFQEAVDHLGIYISLRRGDETILFASIVGRLLPLTAKAVRARLCRQPLPALWVLILIHLHAARLYLRGLRVQPGVATERALVSTSQSEIDIAEQDTCHRPNTCDP